MIPLVDYQSKECYSAPQSNSAEAHLELSRTSFMEFFCENSKPLTIKLHQGYSTGF